MTLDNNNTVGAILTKSSKTFDCLPTAAWWLNLMVMVSTEKLKHLLMFEK